MCVAAARAAMAASLLRHMCVCVCVCMCATHVVPRLDSRTSLRVKGSPVMRSVQFLRFTLSSSTASHAYTFPDGFTATTLEWSVNSCDGVGGLCKEGFD
jgi:hypothetical protein